jgi:hypothetical protein
MFSYLSMKPLHVILLALLASLAASCNTVPPSCPALPTGLALGAPIEILTLGGGTLACPVSGTCVLAASGVATGLLGGILGDVLGLLEDVVVLVDGVLTDIAGVLTDTFTVVQGLAAGPAGVPCISLEAALNPGLFLAL